MRFAPCTGASDVRPAGSVTGPEREGSDEAVGRIDEESAGDDGSPPLEDVDRDLLPDAGAAPGRQVGDSRLIGG